MLVVGLGVLYIILQRSVAERASIRPTMSPDQHKLLRYLPIVFAVIQLFFLAALVVYYIAQTVLRIVQQRYITRADCSRRPDRNAVCLPCDDQIGCAFCSCSHAVLTAIESAARLPMAAHFAPQNHASRCRPATRVRPLRGAR